jgi:serine/threonine-protein kinase
MAWSDASGALETLPIEHGAYYTPRLAPDGDRVVLSVDSDRGQDIFVYDIGRDTLSRLTSTGEANLWPVWAPDGEHVVFTSLTEEQAALWWTRADGTTQPQRLHTSPNAIRQIAISPDGRYVGYTEQDPETDGDLWILPLDLDDPEAPRPQAPRAILQTANGEGVPAFSPDGRWLAYTSDELGPFNIWVQGFPEPSGKWQVTSGDGGYPFWSRTAPELYYFGRRGGFLVEYATQGGRFVPSRARARPGLILNPTPIGFEALDLAPDGRRVVILPYIEPESPGQITFLLNFFEELRARVPVP